MRREYPATSAARIAVRRRTGGMAPPAVRGLDQVYRETGGGPSVPIAPRAFPAPFEGHLASYIPPPLSPPPCSGLISFCSGKWGSYRAPAVVAHATKYT